MFRARRALAHRRDRAVDEFAEFAHVPLAQPRPRDADDAPRAHTEEEGSRIALGTLSVGAERVERHRREVNQTMVLFRKQGTNVLFFAMSMRQIATRTLVPRHFAADVGRGCVNVSQVASAEFRCILTKIAAEA